MYDIEALGADNIRSVLMGERRVRERAHPEIDWREARAGDGTKTLAGYPAVFNTFTTLYDGRTFAIREQLAPGFFDDVLADDCHLNYVHESASAMARNNKTGVGGMQLSVDPHGLRVFANLSMDDVDVQRMAPKMELGIVDQMSFAFSVADEKCEIYIGPDEREYYDYTLLKCKRLYDVCVCPLGQYSETEAMLRSMISAQLGDRSDSPTADSEARLSAGDRSDSPTADSEARQGGEDRSDSSADSEAPHDSGLTAARLAALKARARQASNTYQR